MKPKSWKRSTTVPRFLQAAVRKGLRIADSIGIEEANDGSHTRRLERIAGHLRAAHDGIVGER